MPEYETLTGINIYDLFPPSEGEIDFIYGRIGTGKTLLATRDIIRRLASGQVVYCNWRIDVPDDISEMDSPFAIFLGLIGLKNTFYAIHPRKNLIYLPLDDDYAKKQGFEDVTDWISRITDACIYLDEGHAIFDSYQHAKFSMRKRMAILTTRHFNRTIVVVSQRPTAIHVSARANVNRFFKCERPLAGIQRLLGILLFVKTEYQDMTDETVNEDADPVSTKWYLFFPWSPILKAYNTKYMRGDMPTSQQSAIDVFKLTYKQRLSLILRKVRKSGFSRSADRLTPSPIKLDDTPDPLRSIRNIKVK